MQEKFQYRNYSEYELPSEIKKLDFIITCVNEFNDQKNLAPIKILEIGCGKGNICYPLASLGYNVIGIDLNPDSIRYALQKKHFDNLNFAIGDAETIKNESKFDLIICSEIFEHLEKPYLLRENLFDLIKTDGLLILTIPNGFGPYTLIYDIPLRYILKIFNKTDPYGHKQNFSLNEFTELLKPFVMYQMKNSDFLSFFPIIRKSKILCRIDCFIADFLPYFLASGWYFTFRLVDKPDI
jgi:ubiquinone biosynthesis O-methyltransferase